jgi:hypothetical protein
MARLIRKSAALIAAYAIALQAMVWGFAPAGPFGFDPSAVICTADSSGDHQDAPAQHRSDCGACLAACGSAPGILPANVAFSPVWFSEPSAHLTFLFAAPPLQPRHQPQESRAPPIPS